MTGATPTEANRVWARGFGVTLRPLTPGDLDAPGVQRALRDGIERNYEGELPAPPPGASCHAILAGRALVGVLAFRHDVPSPGAVVFDCLAIVPAQRGHAYAARALLAAERRLRAAACYGRVPRTNGRGLYFMLRCGFDSFESDQKGFSDALAKARTLFSVVYQPAEDGRETAALLRLRHA